MQIINNVVEYTIEEVEAYTKIRKEGLATAFFKKPEAIIDAIEQNTNLFISDFISRYFAVYNFQGTSINPDSIIVSKLDVSKELYILVIQFPSITAYDIRHMRIKDSQTGTAFLYCRTDEQYYSFFFVEPFVNEYSGQTSWLYYKVHHTGRVETLGNYSMEDLNHQLNTFTDMHNSDFGKIVFREQKSPEKPRNASTERNDGTINYFKEKDKAIFAIQTKYFPEFFFKYEENFINELIAGREIKVADLYNWLLETFGFDGNFPNASFKFAIGPKTESFTYLMIQFPPHLYSQPNGQKVAIEHVYKMFLYYNDTFTIFRCYITEPFFIGNEGQRGYTISEVTRRQQQHPIGRVASANDEEITNLLFATFRKELSKGAD